MIYSNAISVKLRMFQFKLLHRKLALNPFLLKIGIKSSDKCSFCGLEKETELHFFCKCRVARKLWNSVGKQLLKEDLNLEQSIYDHSKIFCDDLNFSLNKIFIIVKNFLYVSRCKAEVISYQGCFNYIKEIYYIEKSIAQLRGKITVHNRMWSSIFVEKFLH